MVVVNVYCEEDYNPKTDGYYLTLSDVIDDVLDLDFDIEPIQMAVRNDPNFEPKAGEFYEIRLVRSFIDGDPIPEPIFEVDEIIKKEYDEEIKDDRKL